MIEQIDTYRVLGRLGGGGMADVYRAEDESGSVVALKLYRPGIARSERVERERQIGEQVEHPTIVRMLGSGTHAAEQGECPYLVFELVDGRTLKELRSDLGLVPEMLCRQIARDVAHGLTAIHAEGITHRDIKPANLMITADNQVRILDFGVAGLEDAAEDLTRTGVMIGTPRYAAPEQVAGEEVSAASDLWALGATLYELAVGRPYRDDAARERPGASVAQLMNSEIAGPAERTVGDDPDPLSLTPFFLEVLDSLVAAEPGDRIASADALAEVLDAGASGEWFVQRAARPSARAADPRQLLHVDRSVPFGGRQAELSLLHEARTKAEAGNGNTVVLIGEGGMGKSRLVDEFASQVKHAESIVLVGSSRDSTGPAGALGDAVRTYFPRTLLGTRLTELLEDRPHLATELTAHLTESKTSDLDATAIRAGLIRVLRALSRQRPVVVIVEDLHEGDEEELSRLAALSRVAADEKITVVITARPTLTKTWLADLRRVSSVEVHELGGLGHEEGHELIASADARTPITWAVRERLHEMAGGNPYFAIELARHSSRAGYAEGTALPESLDDLMEAQLAEVSDETRELLERAACIGPTFDIELLAESDPDQPDTSRALVRITQALARLARRHGLVVSRGVEFAFSHQILRDHIYANTPESLRTIHHGHLGRALLKRAVREDPPSDATVSAAEHLLLAGNPSEAAPLVGPALRVLQSRFEHERAAALSGRHLQSVPGEPTSRRLVALLDHCTVLVTWGHATETVPHANEAIHLASKLRDPGSEMRARGLLGIATMAASDFRKAYEEHQIEATLARTAGMSRAALGADLRAARALLFLGDHAVAREQLRSIVASSTQLGNAEQLRVRAMGNLALLAEDPDELDAAIRTLSELRALARDSGDTSLHCAVAANLPYLLQRVSRFKEARNITHEWLSLARETNSLSDEASALTGLVYFARHHGDLRSALDLGMEAWALSKAIGDLRELARACVNLSDACRDIGDLTLGLRVVDEAIAMRGTCEPEVISQAVVNRARLLLAMGRPAAAATHIRENANYIGAGQSSEATWTEVSALVVLGDLSLAAARSQAEVNDDEYGILVRAWRELRSPRPGASDLRAQYQHRSAKLGRPETIELAALYLDATSDSFYREQGLLQLHVLVGGLAESRRRQALKANASWARIWDAQRS